MNSLLVARTTMEGFGHPPLALSRVRPPRRGEGVTPYQSFQV
ncbi:hypothetical protein AvCA_42080 [Azotobacter vinelandii CA]|uniref:Uncharacterized protein n=2 Tax=Azotobacter vinelandii TaxID=354 RepID=C1DF06_AZOVD|nr:hypothetical protein Avin_42080 [Azotobacter vinelandii DJ]AGK14416.1 hypothetical protein AvCA_42080 [Azotobacter vinelandii CA]AGK21861.1 hypothetical protein AvCA6_42080 [Azotobacter vinelandii CA6]